MMPAISSPKTPQSTERFGKFWARWDDRLVRGAEYLNDRYGEIRAALIIGLLCICFSAVLISCPIPPPSSFRFKDMVMLSQHPYSRDLAEPFLAYRIIVPFIGYLLHLRGPSVVILQYVFNALTFAALYYFLRRTAGTWLGVFLCLGLSTTVVAETGNRWWGFNDPFTNLCIVVGMFCRRWWVLALAMAAGCLNDERCIFAIPPIMAWRYAEGLAFREIDYPAGLRRVSRFEEVGVLPNLPWMAGIASAFAIRYALQTGVLGPGISDQAYALFRHYVRLNVIDWILGVVMSFHSLWLMPIVAFPYFWKWDRRFAILGYATVAPLIAATFAPLDHSRSMAVGFPLVVWAAVSLYRWDQANSLWRKYLISRVAGNTA